MELKKLLCAVDGSHSANKAAEYAVSLAQQSGASLSFATVSTMSSSDVAKHFTNWNSMVAEIADQQLHNILRHAQEHSDVVGLRGQGYVVLQGRNAAKALVRHAEAEKYDHIICGSQGLNGLDRLIVGSVAEQIVRLAHCPVTVVR